MRCLTCGQKREIRVNNATQDTKFCMDCGQELPQVVPQNNSSWEERLDIILKGIDKEESEHDSGWWETSTGAEFGKNKLAEIKSFISETIAQEREKLHYQGTLFGKKLWIEKPLS